MACPVKTAGLPKNLPDQPNLKFYTLNKAALIKDQS